MARLNCSKEDRDKVLGIIEAWLEDNESSRGVNFVENIEHQLLNKDFITDKQIDSLVEIIPDSAQYFKSLLTEANA